SRRVIEARASPAEAGYGYRFATWDAPRRDQPASGGLMPAKKSQEISRPTQITKPKKLKTETAGSFPIPSCHSFLKLERTAIEKCQDEKDHSERVGFADGGRHFRRDIRGSTEGGTQTDQECHHEAEDEFRKALPDLRDLGFIRCHVDMVGPDIAEHEGPDVDERVDEYFHGGSGAEDPARLISHALGCRFRQNQRFGDAAASDRRTIGFDRQSNPGACDQWLLPEKSLCQER